MLGESEIATSLGLGDQRIIILGREILGIKATSQNRRCEKSERRSGVGLVGEEGSGEGVGQETKAFSRAERRQHLLSCLGCAKLLRLGCAIWPSRPRVSGGIIV